MPIYLKPEQIHLPPLPLLRLAKTPTSEVLEQALTKIINKCFPAINRLDWFAHCR
ncbi:hypothetical protein [Leptolyngbya sp. FACHB-321]|uniref:hypothetical protein n=1 Tax=Leptolyngbya sp. FACHB-321 TaxID=2692807 RepID=UPI001686D28A|nr:hypothetical protein [Leptolyngbya sp. FACHB-321]